MVRSPEHTVNVVISVFLKNGEKWVNMDIPEQPLGDHERTVTFWKDENTLVAYPMDEVKKYEIVFLD